MSPTFRRERLLVVTVVNHPALIERIAEEFAALPLKDNDLDALRAAILDIAGSGARVQGLDSAGLRQHLTDKGFTRGLERLSSGPGALIDRFARPEAPLEAAEIGWRHTFHLHRRAVTLPTEVEAAARAYANAPSGETKARLDALKEEMKAAADEGAANDLAAASGRDVTI